MRTRSAFCHRPPVLACWGGQVMRSALGETCVARPFINPESRHHRLEMHGSCAIQARPMRPFIEKLAVPSSSASHTGYQLRCTPPFRARLPNTDLSELRREPWGSTCHLCSVDGVMIRSRLERIAAPRHAAVCPRIAEDPRDGLNRSAVQLKS